MSASLNDVLNRTEEVTALSVFIYLTKAKKEIENAKTLYVLDSNMSAKSALNSLRFMHKAHEDMKTLGYYDKAYSAFNLTRLFHLETASLLEMNNILHSVQIVLSRLNNKFEGEKPTFEEFINSHSPDHLDDFEVPELSDSLKADLNSEYKRIVHNEEDSIVKSLSSRGYNATSEYLYPSMYFGFNKWEAYIDTLKGLSDNNEKLSKTFNENALPTNKGVSEVDIFKELDLGKKAKDMLNVFSLSYTLLSDTAVPENFILTDENKDYYVNIIESMQSSLSNIGDFDFDDSKPFLKKVFYFHLVDLVHQIDALGSTVKPTFEGLANSLKGTYTDLLTYLDDADLKYLLTYGDTSFEEDVLNVNKATLASQLLASYSLVKFSPMSYSSVRTLKMLLLDSLLPVLEAIVFENLYARREEEPVSNNTYLIEYMLLEVARNVTIKE